MPSNSLSTSTDYQCPCGICREKRRAEVAESKVEQLETVLKLIAETPEPKDTIQVWAWDAYKKGALDAQ